MSQPIYLKNRTAQRYIFALKYVIYIEGQLLIILILVHSCLKRLCFLLL